MSSLKVSAFVGLWILLAISTSYYQVSCTPVRTGNRIQESDPHLKCYKEILSAESRSNRNWDDHSGVEACGYTHIGYFGSCSNHKAEIEQIVTIPLTSGTTENRIDKGLGDGRLYLFDSAWVAADHAMGVCDREGPSSSSSSPTPLNPMVCMLYLRAERLPTLQKLYVPNPSSEMEIRAVEDSSKFTTSQTVRFGKIVNLPGEVFSDLLYSAWPSDAVNDMIGYCSVLTEVDVLGMGDPKLLTAKTGYEDILKHAKWGNILSGLSLNFLLPF